MGGKSPGAKLAALTAPKKLPKALGECIDLAFDLRAKRKELEAEAEAVKKEEERVKLHIRMSFAKTAIDGAQGARGKAELHEEDVPQIDSENGGWEKLQKHIIETGSWDLMEKRLGKLAAQARWEDGKTIPGIKKFHKVEIKLLGEK